MYTEDRLYASIGTAIANVRARQRLTQEQLADSVELSRTSITNLEKGRQRIQLHTLYAIAECLNVSVSSLLPESSPPFHPAEFSNSVLAALQKGSLDQNEAAVIQRTLSA